MIVHQTLVTLQQRYMPKHRIIWATTVLLVLAACAKPIGPGGGGEGGDGNDNSSGGNGGAGGLADCAGIELTQSGVLDLNLQAVRVQGKVTVNGADMPENLESRGRILFRDVRNAYSFSVSLGITGVAKYDVSLPPGTYDILYDGYESYCANPAAPPIPCNDGVLRKNVALSADGVLDLDVPSVTIQGAVTANGGPLPNSPSVRGWLRFEPSNGSSATTPNLGLSGPATYSLVLFAGSYDVWWDGYETNCGDGSKIACNDGRVLSGKDLTQSGVLDVNVPMVTISGSVTVNGATMPSSINYPRGNVLFAPTMGGDTVRTTDFGTSGPATYSMTIVSGTYDVKWDGFSSSCDGSPQGIPCNDGRLKSSIPLTQDGVLDMDVPTVTISGNVTVNGQTMPAETAYRGQLQFEKSGEDAISTPSFGQTGPAIYTMTLLKGTYDIRFAGNSALCDALTAATVPCNDGVMKKSVAIQEAGVLDIDVPAVTVQGIVTINGEPMVDAPYARGRLAFTLSNSGKQVVTSGFSPTGPANYAATLIAGVYDIEWFGNYNACQMFQPTFVPCNVAPVKSGVSVQSSGVLDVDVPAVQIQGAVTLEGAPLPDESNSRGSITFTYRNGKGYYVTSLGAMGAPTYVTTLVAGRYIVTHDANPALCGASVAAPQVPCLSHALLGCE